MQEKQLFEYAVIRVVPRVEREEFFNVGVILYCRQTKFLQCLYRLDEEKLRMFCLLADADEIANNLQSFERICKGSKGSGPIGKLDAASRFRWLTATRSTIVQSSKVHPGFCTDAEARLQKLFSQLVLA
ncbi:MAG TPA: DUF3037 domain-containing protein [Flavisolibacter sp.]|jgi:hypothetical protein|nr:DUF3037 domain-containing protein [Flavisolibacter sp.]